jgi:beta-phosphoglucomutase-like phosphatase (HAD superfamily)
VALAVERLGAGPFFNALVTGRDVTRGKPDPQVFHVAAERLGVAPADCAVVEDAPVGIAAANAAGMSSCGTAPVKMKRGSSLAAAIAAGENLACGGGERSRCR